RELEGDGGGEDVRPVLGEAIDVELQRAEIAEIDVGRLRVIELRLLAPGEPDLHVLARLDEDARGRRRHRVQVDGDVAGAELPRGHVEREVDVADLLGRDLNTRADRKAVDDPDADGAVGREPLR